MSELAMTITGTLRVQGAATFRIVRIGRKANTEEHWADVEIRIGQKPTIVQRLPIGEVFNANFDVGVELIDVGAEEHAFDDE